MHLPEPLPASQESGAEQAPSMETGPEMTPAAPAERAPRPSTPPTTSVPPVDPQLPVGDDNSGGGPQPAGPAVADDSDKIESEWVVKAKQIVNATRHDPYQQNRQLAAFKADYLKKRYNKIVKLSE